MSASEWSIQDPGARIRGASAAPAALAAVLIVADVVASAAAGGSTALIVLFAVAMTAMLVAGVVVLQDPARAGLGRLLVGIAVAGSLADLVAALPFGPFPFAAVLLYWPYVGLFAHLLMRWPDVRLDGLLGRALLLVAYGLMPVLSLLWELTWSPSLAGSDASARWWATIAVEEGFSATVYDAQQLLYAALILVVAVIVVLRAARARGRRRVAMVPVTVAAVLLTATVGLGVLQGFGVATGLDLSVPQDLAVLAVPAGVLIATRTSGRRVGAAP